MFITGCKDAKVRMFDIMSPNPVKVFAGHLDRVYNELKTKQALLKRVSDKNGNVLELEQLAKNLETRDNRIKDLER
jgi:hypothetical protein